MTSASSLVALPANLSEIPSASQEDLFLEENLFLGSSDVRIVGIRYYRGVAHPGEFIQLVREPQNPYDPNAIRVDNLRQEKIGHIKRGTAVMLARLMDQYAGKIRMEGIIPGPGSKSSLPLLLEFYSEGGQEEASELAQVLKNCMRRAVRMAPNFGGTTTTTTATTTLSPTITASAPSVVTVQKVQMDWTNQQKELDSMFDKQVEQQLQDLPDLEMPSFIGMKLYDFQVQGIRFLVQKETKLQPQPFFKTVMEQGRQMHLCEITQSSQSKLPSPICGSILCDDMGLGKSIQALGLILLAPRAGVQYNLTTTETTETTTVKEVMVPCQDTIKAATVATLKQILKQKNLKCSGSKKVLVQRILEHVTSQVLQGPDFPLSMHSHPPPPSTTIAAAPLSNAKRCTLIVCPVSVMANWTQQVQDHVPDGMLNLQLYHGPSRHRVLEQQEDDTVDILLVSYHTLVADFSATFDTSSGPVRKKAKRQTIFDIHFHRIVLDEAHMIRNRKSKIFLAVSKIKADRKLALTGTPFVNRAEDVFSLLSFLGMEPLGNHQIFQRAISQPLQNGLEIGLARLRTAMGFVSMRRSKHNILQLKMVEKHVQLASVQFEDGDMHKQVYDALYGTVRVAMTAIMKDNASALKNYSSIFEKLLRLRQACCSGLLLTAERREIAIKVWKQVSSGKIQEHSLSAEEGFVLLEKLKGQFTQELPECGICLDEFDQAEGTILKSCSHIFCKSCIQQVLSRSSRKCPYCRKDFCQADIVDMSTAESASKAVEAVANSATGEFGTPPKIVALLQSIQTTLKPDEKGVIFSQFTTYLDVIGDAMKAAGHTFVRIDGSVPALRRIECIQQFNANGGPRFILCSLLASGTGINLTRGNHAFLMDCCWNEAMESQAMDRIHRINQTRTVKVTKFVMKGSIEERIVKMQRIKSMQAKGVMQKLTGDEKRKALLGDLKGLLQIDN